MPVQSCPAMSLTLSLTKLKGHKAEGAFDQPFC